MSKPYNFIYEKLVQGPDDLSGLVAYGLYKREKIEFIEQIRAEGSEASDEQVKDFHRVSNTPARIQSYRSEAESLMTQMMVNLLQNRADEIQALYDKQLSDALQLHVDTVDRLTKGNKFWTGVWQNVAASLIAAIIVTLFVFTIIASKHGFSDTIADWSGYQPKQIVK